MAQRLLTNWETSGFLLRHPLVAEYIGKTKAAILAGVYDWTQQLPDWFFGMIPPWGMSVDDSTYGTVVIFFDVNGTVYLNANVDPGTVTDINKPPYEPPPFKCKNGADPTFGICPEDFNFLYLVGGLGLAYIGYRMFFAKN